MNQREYFGPSAPLLASRQGSFQQGVITGLMFHLKDIMTYRVLTGVGGGQRP